MHKGILRAITAIALVLSAATMTAQRKYEPHFAIGGKGGVTFSQMAFTPGIEQKMVQGIMAGVSFRYTEEKFFGLIGELTVEQRGWSENFEETDFKYSRKLTYIQMPLLTHIYFGGEKVKGFVNLGPVVGYMIGDNISSNFNYEDPASVEGFPLENRHVNQMKMEIKNKVDYGITAGLGCELKIGHRNSIFIEGRYYYGLGNIYSSSKRDESSASRGTSIIASLGYYFHLK